MLTKKELEEVERLQTKRNDIERYLRVLRDKRRTWQRFLVIFKQITIIGLAWKYKENNSASYEKDQQTGFIANEYPELHAKLKQVAEDHLYEELKVIKTQISKYLKED